MNCDAAQRRLLAAERPGRPPEEVRRHMAVCPSCRVWGRTLAQAEEQIPFLPVPPSSAKGAFVRRFVGQGGPVVRRVPMPWPTPPKERGLRKLSLAVAIAAVLAVFTLGLWSWRPQDAVPHTAPVPTLLAQIRWDKEQILTLPTPRERVEGLTDLAADLQERARTMARDGAADDLSNLALGYGELVAGDLPEQARALPPAQRLAVLNGVLPRLGLAESEFHQLATANPGAATHRPLQDLELAARDGSRLLELLKNA